MLQSYTLRNGVLGMMGEILVRVLSKEGLESHQKAARDSFFDRLQVGVLSPTSSIHHGWDVSGYSWIPGFRFLSEDSEK